MNASPVASSSVRTSSVGTSVTSSSAGTAAFAFVVALDGRFGYCGTCAAETVFERPWCSDGHGDLCAEWVCTDCGTAVIVEIGTYLEPLSADDTADLSVLNASRRVVAA